MNWTNVEEVQSKKCIVKYKCFKIPGILGELGLRRHPELSLNLAVFALQDWKKYRANMQAELGMWDLKYKSFLYTTRCDGGKLTSTIERRLVENR